MDSDGDDPRVAPKAGLPHSDIRGSTIARISPRLFAACHVLPRLLVPRHPPDALRRLLEESRAGTSPAQDPSQHRHLRIGQARRQTTDNRRQTPPTSAAAAKPHRPAAKTSRRNAPPRKRAGAGKADATVTSFTMSISRMTDDRHRTTARHGTPSTAINRCLPAKPQPAPESLLSSVLCHLSSAWWR